MLPDIFILVNKDFQKYNNLVYEQVYSSNKTVRQTERQQYMHIYIIRRHSIHIKTTVNAEKN